MPTDRSRRPLPPPLPEWFPRGTALLRDPTLNKGTAFTEDERDALGLRGLLPPHVCTQEDQVARVLENFHRLQTPLAKRVAGSNDPKIGAAYILRKTGGVWAQLEKLTPPAPAVDSGFGTSVALTGDLLAVGAPGYDGQRGGVFLYRRTGEQWTQEAVLVPADAAPCNAFGLALAADGSRLLIATSGDDGCANTCHAGAVYVFREDEAVWTQEAILTAPTPKCYEMFGGALGLSETFALVGAPDPGPPPGAWDGRYSLPAGTTTYAAAAAPCWAGSPTIAR